MTDRPRTPAGSPEGGQYATAQGAEASNLIATPVNEPAWGATEDVDSDDTRWEATVTRGRGDDDFNVRVRLLLGAKANARVAVTLDESRYDIGGWGVTWEGETSVTVTAGGKHRTFATVADLIRRLEHVDPTGSHPAVIHYTDADLLSHLGKPVHLVFNDGHVWTGRVGNARGNQSLLIGDEPVHCATSTQRREHETWSWVQIPSIEQISGGVES